MTAKDKTTTSTITPAKDQSSTSTPTKDQTSSSVAAKDQSSTATPAKDQTSSSVAAKYQSSSSVPVKDQSSSSMPAKDQTSTLLSSKDKSTYSMPSKDQSSSPTSAKDQPSTSESLKDQISASLAAKDSTTSPKSETSPSKTEIHKTETAMTSSTVSSVVVYSFTLPLSTAPISAVLSKSESSASVVISSFTVPSVIYSFTIPSSILESRTSVSVSVPSSKPEVAGSPTKSEQPIGGKDSSSITKIPYYNTSSSVVPLWTADMLGNAYGGGFINIPSIYVTLAPTPTTSAKGVPPGYGYSLKPETQSADKSSFSNDKAGLGGSQSQTVAISGSGVSYTTNQYGIPTFGALSSTGIKDCCGDSTTLSVGKIDSSGIQLSPLIGGLSALESSATSYTFGPILAAPSGTGPYGGNSSLPNRNGSSNGTGALLNPTSLPEYSALAIKNTIGFAAGILGMMVFVFLI